MKWPLSASSTNQPGSLGGGASPQLRVVILLSSPFVIGVKGQVTDQNGNPIPNAIVEAEGRRHICPYRTNEQGEYFLLLLPGTYVINVSVRPYYVIVWNCVEFLSVARLRPCRQMS